MAFAGGISSSSGTYAVTFFVDEYSHARVPGYRGELHAVLADGP
jgi:hypothetical protein